LNTAKIWTIRKIELHFRCNFVLISSFISLIFDETLSKRKIETLIYVFTTTIRNKKLQNKKIGYTKDTNKKITNKKISRTSISVNNTIIN